MEAKEANARKKVVVFEDDLAFRSSYVSALESRGFEAIVYASPQDVTRKELKSLKPDLISYDIFMPGLTGIEAAKAYTSDSTIASIPFIFVSSQQGQMKDEAMKLEPREFFSKFETPISEIVRYIDQLLHSSHT